MVANQLQKQRNLLQNETQAKSLHLPRISLLTNVLLRYFTRGTTSVQLGERKDGWPTPKRHQLEASLQACKTSERSYTKWAKKRQDRLDSLVTGTGAKVGGLVGRQPAGKAVPSARHA